MDKSKEQILIIPKQEIKLKVINKNSKGEDRIFEIIGIFVGTSKVKFVKFADIIGRIGADFNIEISCADLNVNLLQDGDIIYGSTT
jgi:hypothetical protein